MQGGQQTRKDEKELTSWFATVLKFRSDDVAVAAFDNLKNGVAVVQLLHSIAPELLDLARCDFVPSKEFHFTKNWKLAQEAVSLMKLDIKIEIEMLVQGDKSRALYALTQYLQHNYSILKSKYLNVQKGSGHHTSNDSLRHAQPHALTLLPSRRSGARQSSGKPPVAGVPPTTSGAASLAEPCEESVNGTNVETPHKRAQRQQQSYDPEAERVAAIERRSKRLLSHSHISDLQSAESMSHRSGDSVGVHSYRSGGQLSARAVSGRGSEGFADLRVWMQAMQAPTPRRDSGSSPDNCLPTDWRSPSAAAADGSTSERSPSLGDQTSPSLSAVRTTREGIPQQLAGQMQLHRYESLGSLSLFSLLRRHHACASGESGNNNTSRNVGVLPTGWGCVDDVEGDADLGYIPYEQLVNAKPSASTAWDAFDSLFR
jgi:hypothetical protein